MSESTVIDAPPPETEELFSRQELAEFSADDQEAGRAICKMLSMFFFYTVIVMGLSTWFTYLWVSAK